MIKMIVSSFYNTLIDEEDAIPTSTMFLMDCLKQQNVKLTILTNRSLEDVLYYNNDYPFIDYIIAYNGGIVYDVVNDVILKKRPFTNEEIMKLPSCEKDNVHYFYEDNELYKVEEEISKKDLKKYKDNAIVFYRDNRYFVEYSPSNSFDIFQIIVEKEGLKKNEILSFVGNESEEKWIFKYLNTYVVNNGNKKLKKIAINKTKSNTKKGVEFILKKVKRNLF